MDRVFWGFSSFGYHVTSFSPPHHRRRPVLRLVHAATRRAGQARSGLRFSPRRSFALHPLMSGTVVLRVGAVRAAVRAGDAGRAHVRAPRDRERRVSLPGVTAAAFGALAAASSASAAALPAVVLVYDAWVLKSADGSGASGAPTCPRWWRSRSSSPGICRHRAVADRVPARGASDKPADRSHRHLAVPGLLVVPAGQSIVHQVRWVTSAADPHRAAALAGNRRGDRRRVSRQARRAVARVRDDLVLRRARRHVGHAGARRDGGAPALSCVRRTPACRRVVLARPLATRRTCALAALRCLLLLSVLTYRRVHVWSEPLELWEEAVAPLARSLAGPHWATRNPRIGGESGHQSTSNAAPNADQGDASWFALSYWTRLNAT